MSNTTTNAATTNAMLTIFKQGTATIAFSGVLTGDAQLLHLNHVVI